MYNASVNRALHGGKEREKKMCFRPDTRARRLSEVNLYVLRHIGIRVLLLDADNTLTRWNETEIAPEIKEWVRLAKALGMAALVISNNGPERLQPLAETLEINCFPRMRKPLPFRTKKLLRQLGFAPQQCAVIGDQILTDVMLGKSLGAHTVLLDPIDTAKEYWWTTRVNRPLEKLIKKLWKIV